MDFVWEALVEPSRGPRQSLGLHETQDGAKKLFQKEYSLSVQDLDWRDMSKEPNERIAVSDGENVFIVIRRPVLKES